MEYKKEDKNVRSKGISEELKESIKQKEEEEDAIPQCVERKSRGNKKERGERFKEKRKGT